MAVNYSEAAARVLKVAFDREYALMVWDMEHPKPDYRRARRAYWEWKRARAAYLPKPPTI